MTVKGKDYLEVKYRLVWFREDHPTWSIETNYVWTHDNSALARAVIKDEAGRVIATSHKAEHQDGFPDFLEKAETGAIGRALALIGYGTQFCADELDEGERIVDSPIEAKHEIKNVTGTPSVNGQDGSSSRETLANFRINFGKYRGKKLSEVTQKDMDNYLSWLESEAEKKNSALSVEAAQLKRAAEQYYVQEDDIAF
jgi:hypothetical protein